MQFKKETAMYSYEVHREGTEDILYLNYVGAPFVPNIAEYAVVMERVVDVLIESPNVSRVVLVQDKNYNYDFEETSFLLEVAQLYVHFLKQEKVLSQDKLVSFCPQFFLKRYNQIFSFMYLLKRDPIAAFFELRKVLIEARIDLKNSSPDCKLDNGNYVRFVEGLVDTVSRLKLVQKADRYFDDYTKGERDIYDHLFKPDSIPNFTFTRLVLDFPSDSEILAEYKIMSESYDESFVTILRQKEKSKLLYYLSPPENNLSEDHSSLLNMARSVLIEHQPQAEEFTDTQRTRQVFFNIAKDLLQDLAQTRNLSLSYNEINKLATILVRHTIGFGVLEILLQDKNLQDIVLNAPISQTPVFLRHQKFDECSTNILPSNEDINSWAAKFRMISGRPLDEANPILDTQLGIGNLRARIAIVQEPLSPDGLAYAIRRHRENPWTLPLFVNNRMLNSFAAGLLSFMIDGSRTLLIAGTRSSGKTSLLGSLMLEIMPRYRVIVVEDSLELPVESMRKLDYDILRMKVRSALLKTSTEVSADEGIRTSLRLGDSSLIMGEIRSTEAKALYEAMRVGALANVVAGTIHGASPYGVFDRVVNDLEVPATSFKATDLIVVCNPIKTPDGLSSVKRVVQITEIRKHWKEDPNLEGGFVNLMNYNVETDELEPSADLINGDSEIIKDIASNIKGWAGDWDAVYDNIVLRAKIKQELVDVANSVNNLGLLESEFNTLSNHMFHKISEEVRKEVGLPKSESVFPRWKKWLNDEIKKRKIL